MTEIRIITLLPGSLRHPPEQIPARWHDDDGAGGVRTGSLAQALEACGTSRIGLLMSVADVLLTSVSISRKQARHLSKILPYLLEERLAVDPETQWYATGKAVNGEYPVVVVHAEPVRRLHQWLLEQDADIAGLAVDAQLLSDLAPVLVADDDQVVMLDAEQEPLSLPAEQFEDYLRALDRDTSAFSRLTGSEARQHMRARWSQRIELLHSELRIEKQRPGRLDAIPKIWRQAAVATAALLLCVWTLAWVQAWQFHRLAEQARDSNAALYQQLFPGDRATARLSQQFRSRLAQLGASGSGDAFIALMTPVGSALAAQKEQGMQPKRLLYEQREGMLLLDVEANTYEQLEALKGEIEGQGFNVELANFRNQGERVAARLKVAQL